MIFAIWGKVNPGSGPGPKLIHDPDDVALVLYLHALHHETGHHELRGEVAEK